MNSDMVGQVIGRYRVLGKLGSGGMATVYQAQDTRLERQVAIKFIRQDEEGRPVGDKLLARFEREAKSLAGLMHPNIVAVHDFGEHEGMPYIVMAYIPGGTLKTKMGNAMPYDQAAALAAPVARALEYAHQRDIIHRDVKPANILLTQGGQPVLSDFGIIKITDTVERTSVTSTGFGVGTPEYMAPEQWRNDVSPKTDIYALGVVFYELLTGRRPYSAKTPAEILLKVMTEPLPSARQFSPNLPPEAEAVLVKALARDPAQRYGTMGEFAQALEHLAAGKIRKTPAGEETAPDGYVTSPSAPGGYVTSPSTPPPPLPDNQITYDQLATPQKPPAPRKRFTLKWVLGGLGALMALTLVMIFAGVWFFSSGARFAAATVTATPLPLPSPSATSTPAPTPTALPQAMKIAGTLVAIPPPPITVSNAANLGLQGRLGSGVISGLAFSPDGKRLAVAGSIGIHLFDTLTFMQTGLIPSDAWVYNVTFSADGKRLAGGSDGYNVRVWDVTSGELLHTLEGHKSLINAVAFSPDGSLLASASDDKTVRVWEANSGALRFVLEGSTIPLYVNAVVFSADGKWLVSGMEDGNVMLWDSDTGKRLRTFKGHTLGVYGVGISPDGKRLVSASYDKTVRVWDSAYGGLLQTKNDQGAEAMSELLPGTEAGAVQSTPDSAMQMWETASNILLKTITGGARWVENVSFSADGRRLASLSWSVRARAEDIASGVLVQSLKWNSWSINSLACSMDGKWIASGMVNGAASVWNLSTGDLQYSLEGQGKEVLSVAFSPDGAWLAAGSDDHLVRMWDLSNGKLARSLDGHSGYVNSVAFSPDGEKLVSGGGDIGVQLWDALTGEKGLRMTERGFVTSVVFSSDGKLLASGTGVEEVRLWDVASGTLMQTFEGHSDDVTDVVFSPDGKRMASSSNDNTLRVWDISAGSVPMVLEGHTEYVYSVAFSPDGSLIASASEDGSVGVWDSATGQLLQTLSGHAAGVSDVVFTPDGRLLVSASRDGVIRLWSAANSAE